METTWNLEGAAVLVTGASRGLGAALARRLGSRGARLVLIARGTEELSAVVGEIRAAGGTAHALVEDIADKRAVHRIAAVAAEMVGPIDVLVHNASTLGPLPMPLLADTECEDLASVLETNLVGPFRLTRALVGGMVLRQQGLVVHVTSDAATSAYPRWGAYGISKAALEHLGRVLHAELEGSGVRVATVDPGEMNTRMHRDALPDADPTTLADPDAVAARLVALIERPPPGADTVRLGATP